MGQYLQTGRAREASARPPVVVFAFCCILTLARLASKGRTEMSTMWEIRPWLAVGVFPVYGRNRCSLCAIQCSGVVASTNPRSYVEQRLVSPVSFRGHQLHQKLGLRMFRSFRVLGWSVPFDDLPLPADLERRGRARTSPLCRLFVAPQCAVESTSKARPGAACPTSSVCSFHPWAPEK